MAKKTLSQFQLFCLRQVAERDVSTWPVCKAAIDQGLNTRKNGRYEWADTPSAAGDHPWADLRMRHP